MGIPKFFRWLSEKYPLINYPIESTSTPEFDYLYLDMNGIIHNCTHPRENDPLLRITETKMFVTIITYIDKLFKAIKPRKGLFMAIDGCAPRAKMNQQRQRRFRSAMETRVALERAQYEGENIPEEPAFDSNVITPGTEFMAKLSEHLQFFIRKKISEDNLWKGIDVVYSGHDVPGEGEHKIMQFLRNLKSSKDYQPNLRHCLYGLDADLIMLGLISHEPNFSLLREEVLTRVGKTRDKDVFVKEEFHLLSLTLLREYMEEEFLELWKTEQVSFEFDLERVIDDFVLMAFFIGNDFLPNLHVLDIGKGGMEQLFENYKNCLPKMKGYMSSNGVVDWDNVNVFLSELRDYEENQMYEMPLVLKLNESYDGSRESSDDDKHRNDNFYEGIKERDDSWKQNYYKERNFKQNDQHLIKDMAYNYAKGVQWVFHYYVNGCVSWEWFYPYHYPPLICDLKDFSEMKGLDEFVEGKPFHPFEQLLAVLPPDSRHALPVPYRSLMVSENSPLIHFYPSEFKIDMNGKGNDWEGIVLIPFFDQKLLQQEYDKVDTSQLTEEEKKRNKFGETQLYKWDLSVNHPLKSTLPTVFNDIDHCHSVVKNFPMPVYVKENVLVFRKETGLHLNSPYFFPTFSLLEHKFISARIGAKIFSFPSKYPTRVLLVPRSDWSCPGIDDLKEDLSREDEIRRDRQHITELAQLLRRIVFVKYPYQQLGRIAGFSTRTVELLGHNIDSVEELREEESKNWSKLCNKIDSKLFKKRGVNIGPFSKKEEKIPMHVKVHTLIHIQKLKRMVQNDDGTTSYEWSKKAKGYPLDLVMIDKKKPVDPRYIIKKQPDTLENLYPVGSNVLIYNEKYLGVKAKVVGYVDQSKVSVQFSETPDLSFKSLIQNDTSQKFDSSYLEKLLGFTSRAISILSSSLYIQVNRKRKIDLGLGLRFHGKGLQRDGYCFFDQSDTHMKYGRGNWLYTSEAVELFRNYKITFPKVFEFAKNIDITDNKPTPNDIFPDLTEKQALHELESIETWIRSQPHFRKPLIDIGALLLNTLVISKIEQQLLDSKKQLKPNDVLKVESFSRNELKRPIKDLLSHNHSRQHHTNFSLGDRVANMMEDRALAFGVRGTVCGINKSAMLVMWDEEYIGGEAYAGCTSTRMDLTVPLSTVINTTRYTGDTLWNNNNNNNNSNTNNVVISNNKSNSSVVTSNNKPVISLVLNDRSSTGNNNNNNNSAGVPSSPVVIYPHKSAQFDNHRNNDRGHRNNDRNNRNTNDKNERNNERNNDRNDNRNNNDRPSESNRPSFTLNMPGNNHKNDNNNNTNNKSRKTNKKKNNNNNNNKNNNNNNNKNNRNNSSSDSDDSDDDFNDRPQRSKNPRRNIPKNDKDVIKSSSHHTNNNNNDHSNVEPYKKNSKFRVILKNQINDSKKNEDN